MSVPDIASAPYLSTAPCYLSTAPYAMPVPHHTVSQYRTIRYTRTSCWDSEPSPRPAATTC
eukprot:3068769-Rhodomonas_salina.3